MKSAKRSTRPGKRPSRSEPRIKYLDQDQVRALFREAKSRPVRDQLLLAFLYRFGMRASEAAALPTDAVDARRAEVTIQGEKGGVRRTYTIPRDLRPLLRRHRPSGAYFFSTRESGESGRMSRTRVWQVYREAADAAGIARGTAHDPGFGVHSLRHSAAVHALDAGLGLEDVRDLLRHRRIASTEVYGEISVRRRNDYLRRLDESGAVVKVR